MVKLSEIENSEPSGEPIITIAQLSEEDLAKFRRHTEQMLALDMCIRFEASIHLVRLTEEEISKYRKHKPEDGGK